MQQPPPQTSFRASLGLVLMARNPIGKARAQLQFGSWGLTTLSSSESSRVDGSGIPPSITHRLDSYFVRMKFSILLPRSAYLPQKLDCIYIRLRRYMARCKIGFPIPGKVLVDIDHTRRKKNRKSTHPEDLNSLVRARVSPLDHTLYLLVRPAV
jgi:hypothetical protein